MRSAIAHCYVTSLPFCICIGRALCLSFLYLESSPLEFYWNECFAASWFVVIGAENLGTNWDSTVLAQSVLVTLVIGTYVVKF